MKPGFSRLAAAALVLVLLASAARHAIAGNLTGAGATLPYPLYSRWFDEYARTNPGVNVNYQSIGSGGGIRQIMERTVDFGASDIPMSDAQLAKAPGLVHVPMALGEVVIIYNLPGVPDGLKLNGDAIAGIFLGTIARWNDARLRTLNPGVALPDLPITVVHRSEGSGTTNILTDYLSRVNATWAKRVGRNASVRWPVGLGSKGNEGVAGQVKGMKGSVGYTELAYAVNNKLSRARVKNPAGEFVEPTVEAVTRAAELSAKNMSADLRVSIVNSPGKGSYPISGFTYILAYREQQDAGKGKALAQLLWWAIHDGQKFSAALLYAPLPPSVVALDEGVLKRFTAKGRPLLP